ncbi:MAG: IgGFc-binding protein, partial [Polyangiaceae bacterium]
RERVAGSNESVPWRLVGAVDGTLLTDDPAAPAGAPSTLKLGQVVELDSPGPFVVSSQDDKHPFYFAAHMTGGGAGTTLGDPETVNLVAPAQFLQRYVFFTDPTYGYTDLVVVRPKSGAKDVTLDCAGALTGWQPVGARYEYTRVDVQWSGAAVGGCDNGRHQMTSAAPFGVTVWGFDQAVSYAYPAGASVRPINAVVVPTQLQ